MTRPGRRDRPDQVQGLGLVALAAAGAVDDGPGPLHRRLDPLARGQVAPHELDPVPGLVAAAAERPHGVAGVRQPRDDEAPERARAAGERARPTTRCRRRGSRLSRSDAEAIEHLGSWLTTVVSRVCLNVLQARRSRPEVPLGPDAPEPAAGSGARSDPEQEAMLAESVGLALLVVLDTLSPAERVAFVLHDPFGVPLEEIAPIVGRTPPAARQLASRARRRVRGCARAGGPTRPGTPSWSTPSWPLPATAPSTGSSPSLTPDVVLRADRPRRGWAPHGSSAARTTSPGSHGERAGPRRRASTGPPRRCGWWGDSCVVPNSLKGDR